MRDIQVLGVGMHQFGQFPEKSLKDLARTAVLNAIEEAQIPLKAIEVAYVGNAYAGILSGQESIRGHVITRDLGLAEVPVMSVENACASGSSAFHNAWLAVASGLYECALAVGVEKLFVGDTARSAAALATSSDTEVIGGMGFSFTTLYGLRLRKYMAKYGATQEQFAKVAVKNTFNGSLNPYAQHQKPRSLEDVLTSKPIVYPLTLLMCSGMGDGAAAAVLASPEFLARHGAAQPPVQVAASIMTAGSFIKSPEDEERVKTGAQRAIAAAYEKAGVGPRDLEVIEVHDAMAPAELTYYEALGLAAPGEGGRLIDEGVTALTGRHPVNPSGGLAARGHPVGATGLAQIAELVWQLRGQAGPRQVPGHTGQGPRLALAQNSGGFIEGDSAVSVVHVLKR